MVIRFSRGDVIALAGSPFFLLSFLSPPPPPLSPLPPSFRPSSLYFLPSALLSRHSRDPCGLLVDGLTVVKFAIGRFLFMRRPYASLSFAEEKRGPRQRVPQQRKRARLLERGEREKDDG